MNPIYFYRTQAPYGFCSNFAAFPIELDGHVWPTTEHYFQAQKFLEPEHQTAIRESESPMLAARMGRSHTRPLRADWESIKDDVMYSAVLAKFQQHADIQAALLATGEALLVEHTTKDSYWGDGGDGSGLNKLGQILMQVRTELRQKHS